MTTTNPPISSDEALEETTVDKMIRLFRAMDSIIRMADRSKSWQEERLAILKQVDDFTGRDNHGINHKRPFDEVKALSRPAPLPEVGEYVYARLKLVDKGTKYSTLEDIDGERFTVFNSEIEPALTPVTDDAGRG